MEREVVIAGKNEERIEVDFRTGEGCGQGLKTTSSILVQASCTSRL